MCSLGYYSEPESHNENKIKVELQTWTKYSTKIPEIK